MTDVNEQLPAPAAVLHWARLTPQAPAVVDRDVVVSYGSLARQVAACAAFLAACGLRAGMSAGLQCDDRSLHLVLILACEVVGAASISVSALDLATDPGLCRSLQLICRDTDSPIPPAEGQVRVTTAQARVAAAADVALDTLDIAWPAQTLLRIVRTSGTTGASKLVGVRVGEIPGRRATQLYTASRAGIQGSWLALYNFTHASAYHMMLCATGTGGTLLFHDLESFVAGFDDLPPFIGNLLPAEAAWLAERCAQLGKRARRSFMQVGGGVLPQALRTALTTHVATDVQSIYASNETGRIAIVGADGVGDLVPGAQCRILDEQGRDLGWNEPGIIAVRTAALFAGYLGAPPATGTRITDGWLITSDQGVMPEPGRLIVLGRRDDMLNIAGTKVAPQPYEERLRTLSGVREAVLLSVPDGLGIDRLLIVLEMPDSGAPPIDPAQVEALLPRNLGGTDLIRVTGLPRTETGKVRRVAVRDWWIAHRR
jgi:acyl-coenzyme A synthetase/AMP-(fatty) acid ligase